MTAIVTAQDLSQRDRSLLFWASFLSLAAAGVGFSFRVAMGGAYGGELGLTNQQVGQIFGASLWPIALTMIGFSLVVDRTGYKLPMFAACVLQVVSGVGTYFAGSYDALYGYALCAGLAHGIIEAVINPVCAAVYPKQKTKMLTILHAAWPAGLVVGTLCIIGADGIADGLRWQLHALWIVIPAVIYGLMFLPCRVPVDERVQAGVPYRDMLQQVGLLGAALASFMMIYELGNQGVAMQMWSFPASWAPETWFYVSLAAGVAVGIAFGFAVRSVGQPLFFLMCLLMIPVATAELGTDQWIKNLMTPVLDDEGWNPAFALVFSAFIMLVFRVFAGGILRVFSPPTLLCLSGVFSAVGLWWLSSATGAAIFTAFVLYALGQTYYWPCVLGFVSERYPRGGALTLNTVSAIGLLSVGIIGGQLLGVAFDKSIQGRVQAEAPAVAAAATEKGGFLWMEHDKLIPTKVQTHIASLPEAESEAAQATYNAAEVAAGRDVLSYAVRFPAILILAFGAIALWFRARGGYRPIELTNE